MELLSFNNMVRVLSASTKYNPAVAGSNMRQAAQQGGPRLMPGTSFSELSPEYFAPETFSFTGAF